MTFLIQNVSKNDKRNLNRSQSRKNRDRFLGKTLIFLPDPEEKCLLKMVCQHEVSKMRKRN